MQEKKVQKKQKVIQDLTRYIPQKSVRNESLQSLEVYFINETGETDTYWLQPKEIIKIPSSGVTSQLKLLQERRMIRMRDV